MEGSTRSFQSQLSNKITKNHWGFMQDPRLLYNYVGLNQPSKLVSNKKFHIRINQILICSHNTVTSRIRWLNLKWIILESIKWGMMDDWLHRNVSLINSFLNQGITHKHRMGIKHLMNRLIIGQSICDWMNGWWS